MGGAVWGASDMKGPFTSFLRRERPLHVAGQARPGLRRHRIASSGCPPG